MAAEELDKLTVITDLSHQGKPVWSREMILNDWDFLLCHTEQQFICSSTHGLKEKKSLAYTARW